MSLAARTPLIVVDRSIWSSYTSLRDKSRRLRMCEIGETARCPADFNVELVKLDKAVTARGGRLMLSGLGRHRDRSDEEHAKWKEGKRKHYAKPGGFSNHNAYRAFDAWVVEKQEDGTLKPIMFPHLPADENLDEFWRANEDAGDYFTPIIREADETATEHWHHDGFGEWSHVYDRLRSKYGGAGIDMCAMAMCLDVGIGGYGGGKGWRAAYNDRARNLQGQLIF